MIEQPKMKRFVAIARRDCANFSTHGPSSIRDYCCYEPINTNQQCKLIHMQPCQWFSVAVMRSLENRALIPAWDALCRSLKTDGQETPTDTQETACRETKLCACGRHFRPSSNRQQRCSECSERESKNRSRERSRQHRMNKGSASRFRPKIAQQYQ